MVSATVSASSGRTLCQAGGHLADNNKVSKANTALNIKRKGTKGLFGLIKKIKSAEKSALTYYIVYVRRLLLSSE